MTISISELEAMASCGFTKVNSKLIIITSEYIKEHPKYNSKEWSEAMKTLKKFGWACSLPFKGEFMRMEKK